VCIGTQKSTPHLLMGLLIANLALGNEPTTCYNSTGQYQMQWVTG